MTVQNFFCILKNFFSSNWPANLGETWQQFTQHRPPLLDKCASVYIVLRKRVKIRVAAQHPLFISVLKVAGKSASVFHLLGVDLPSAMLM